LVKKALMLVLMLLLVAAGAATVWRQQRPAGKLVQVAAFGANPTGLAMHIYVPPQVSPRPAILLALHYCTGTGPAFYSNTGYAQKADELGFIVIFPSATREGHCWDVHSAAALTHGGGSDPQGLLSMIDYVVAHHGADRARVFVTGHSSGGMMTQVLLGAYPDVFRAGASFAGVPFGCFAGPGEWNEDCSLGRTTKSAAEWGGLVRSAYPGFTGTRPSLQLWHGTGDEALHFNNFGEAIKQWTDVLGLGATPVSVEQDVPAKKWTRSRYADASGNVRLEAHRGEGVPHDFTNPADEVIRFFGLDVRQGLILQRLRTGSCGFTAPSTPTSASAVSITVCGPSQASTGSYHSLGECAPPPMPPPFNVAEGMPRLMGTLLSVLDAPTAGSESPSALCA
jgi:poly(hydroxyalkanoate) depolymerase family esterase